MKIFTSYYGSKTLDRNRHFLVQVSNSAPKGFEPDVKWEEVVPDWDTLVKPSKDGEITEFTYRTRYNTQLQSSAFSIVLAFESIAKQAAGKDIVLLCYEKPDDFCHRHVLAEWIKGWKTSFLSMVPEVELNTIDELGTGQLTLF